MIFNNWKYTIKWGGQLGGINKPKKQFIDYPADNWAPCHNNNDISGQATDSAQNIQYIHKFQQPVGLLLPKFSGTQVKF